jgi:hypothetical protein
MRVVDRENRYIGFRLNLLGLRVWKDRCQLVARDRDGKWDVLGPSRRLPIRLPDDVSAIGTDTLLLTAFQYESENPGSDLRALLDQRINFDDAIEAFSDSTP